MHNAGYGSGVFSQVWYAEETPLNEAAKKEKGLHPKAVQCFDGAC
jgi:hypothetical protein